MTKLVEPSTEINWLGLMKRWSMVLPASPSSKRTGICLNNPTATAALKRCWMAARVSCPSVASISSVVETKPSLLRNPRSEIRFKSSTMLFVTPLKC
ncbi:Uncharacterised protein [Vibrio cholerae]|nr:Uncharacterised protein [Vibrio cholerae]